MNHIDPSEKGGYFALVFSMAVTMVFMVYIAFIHPGVSIDQNALDTNEVPEQAQPANTDSPTVDPSQGE